ncbi:hypothetical protein Gpo141_00007660 [Globisporangium polare]
MDAPTSDEGVVVDGYGALAVVVVAPPPPPVAAAVAVARGGGGGGRRTATGPRAPRRLYHAEQLMEERKLPKKKYLATQRLRRDLERSSVESLKLDVNFLRQEIVNLRTVREIVQAQRLTTRADMAGGLMGKVAQFYATVKHGVGGEGPSAQLSAADKIRFLRGIMHEDLHFGPSTHGIDKFIQQCAGYTLFYSRLCIEAPKLREVQSPDAIPIIVATAQLRVRILRKSLEVIFPHTLSDEVLVQELIGQEVLYPCESRFFFNSEGKVVHNDIEVDFVAGFNAALRSLRKVTEIMDRARLDGAIILMEDDEIDMERLVAGGEDEMKAVAVQEDGRAHEVAIQAPAVHNEKEAPVVPDLPSPVVNRMSIGMLLS